jgi:hypothetical protein
VLAVPTTAGPAVKTNVSISTAKYPAVTGRLSARKPECVANRRVALQDVGLDGGWEAFDSILTKKNGRYTMHDTTGDTGNQLRVIAKAKVIDGVSCARGTSPVGYRP